MLPRGLNIKKKLMSKEQSDYLLKEVKLLEEAVYTSNQKNGITSVISKLKLHYKDTPHAGNWIDKIDR
jgi:hypothetical protein